MPSITHLSPNRKTAIQGSLALLETADAALPEFKWISLKKIVIDLEYQRTQINVRVVNKIASDFSWTDFGAVTVMLRDDGTYGVVDGQHRVRAAVKRGMKAVPCMVTPSLGTPDEAYHLQRINSDRTNLHPVDKYRAMVHSQNPVFIAIHKMLAYLNRTISKSSNGAGSVAFPQIIISTFKASPRCCEKALYLQTRIISNSPHPMSSDIHKGLFYILRHLPVGSLPAFEQTAEKAFAKCGGRNSVISSIRERAMSTTKRHDRACAYGILAIVNKGLHKHFTLIEAE